MMMNDKNVETDRREQGADHDDDDRFERMQRMWHRESLPLLLL